MFFEKASKLYAGFLHEQASITVPDEYVHIAKLVIRKIGWKTTVKSENVPMGKVANIGNNQKVMLALSGGMDSVYLMHRLIDDGFQVVAVHVAGLNKNATKYEVTSAKQTAIKAGAEYRRIKFTPPAQAFPDNPFKNQLILSMLLDIGVKEGIYRYAVGSDWTTPLSEATTGFTITDSREVNKEYWNGVKQCFPQAELVFIPDDVKKYERIKYLHKKGVLPLVSSCVSPYRFRAYRHRQNEEKYGIKLMGGVAAVVTSAQWNTSCLWKRGTSKRILRIMSTVGTHWKHQKHRTALTFLRKACQ